MKLNELSELDLTLIKEAVREETREILWDVLRDIRKKFITVEFKIKVKWWMFKSRFTKNNKLEEKL